MTRRQRVQMAVEHREPDRMPIDCGGMRSTGIMAIAYNRLKDHLGITGGSTKVYDSVQQLALPEQWYLDRFDVNVVDLARAFAQDEDDWVDWQLPDGSAARFPRWLHIEPHNGGWICLNEDGVVIAEMPASATYFSQKVFPLNGILPHSFEELPRWMSMSPWAFMTDPIWKNAARPDFWHFLQSKARELYETTDYAIMLGFGGNLFEWGQFLYRTDDFLINLLTEERCMQRLLDALTEHHLANLEKVLDAVSPYVQMIQFGDDLGTQNASMISPELYRKLFFPRHKRLFTKVRERGVKVFFHTCGAVADLIPDFIEAGVDILNPVQIGANGMAPARLKQQYGTDICFWGGGIDTQHVLSVASPETVKEEVRKNCSIFHKDGGFVFNQVHNIVANVPPANVVAMYEAASEF